MHDYLWISDVGCKMWSLTAYQPLLYAVYQKPTKELLVDPKAETSCHGRITHEIGTFVHELFAGEIYAIWSLYSPITIKDSQTKHIMQGLCTQALSKQFYGSIKNAAFDCFKQAWSEPKVISDLKLKQCICILNSGITLFEQHKIQFNSVLTVPEIEDINAKIRELHIACEQSSLPDFVCQTQVKNQLLELRKHNLLGTAESLDGNSQGNYASLQMCQKAL